MTESFTRARRTRHFVLGAALGLSAISPVIAETKVLLPLMPMPRAVEQQEGALRVNGPFAAKVDGCGALVAQAMERFEGDFVELAGAPVGNAPVPLAVRCLARDPAPVSLEAREGYRLTVEPARVAIEADGEAGVLRALATLRQLAGRDAQGVLLPLVRIDDAPRFPWRGLMVDTARHFVGIPTLKRQIDAMELAKLNVLHLHLSDNEGWRVESKVFPRLTTVASHGEYYTQAEIRDLVRYAADRGVRIVPEIDLPGHSMALLTAYPELAVAPIDPADKLAKQKSALDPTAETTYRFLDKLLGELSALFPDRQFHVGGDEVSSVAWDGNPRVEAFKRKHGLTTKQQVEARFHARVRQILAKRGKSTVGWDEIAEEELPDDVIVQAWRTSNPISTATAQGNRVIVSAGLYLNNLQDAATHYLIDPLDPVAYSTMSAEMLAAVRRNPVTAAQVSEGLVAKPMPPLTPEQEKLVLGGEAPLWAEAVNDELVEGRLWPRALALAERFWSPKELRNPTFMYARLLRATDQLRALGLRDETIRQRMLARLAPDAVETLDRLIGQVAPARHGGNHPEAFMGMKPALVELSDAASTDPSPARRFRVDTGAYLSGDRARAAALRATMKGWRDNFPAFQRVAADHKLLEKAVPTALDLSDLGELGLLAIEAIESGKPLKGDRLRDGRALLAKLHAYEMASADYSAVGRSKQPPGELIILAAPDVQRLVDAAMKGE